MKKIYSLLICSAFLVAEQDDTAKILVAEHEHKLRNDLPQEQNQKKNAIVSDVIELEHIVKQVKNTYEFGKALFVDIQGNPKSYAIVGATLLTVGTGLGIFIHKRFYTIGKLFKEVSALRTETGAGFKELRNFHPVREGEARSASGSCAPIVIQQK